jgi:SAM-dependent methyltransferase
MIDLPPMDLRPGAEPFKQDDVYLRTAGVLARRVMALVDQPESVLDVGCGTARLLFGLLNLNLDAMPFYTGLDVHKGMLAWDQQYLAVPGEVEFFDLVLANERYNPNGRAMGDWFRFPLEDVSFDVVHAYSVLTHLRQETALVYLSEMARVLAPSGRAYITAFVGGKEPFAINPGGYCDLEQGSPLHFCVYDTGVFEGMLAEAGFSIVTVDDRTLEHTHSGFTVRRRE